MQFCLGVAVGLENCVDLLSSVVVVWRFNVPPFGKLTEEKEKELEKREERASMAISIILILLGLFVTSGAIDDLAKGPEKKSDLNLIMKLSAVSIFVFGTLAIFKFHYSQKLNSPSLYKDGLCSLLGTVLSCALFVNTLIIEKYPQTWYLDPVVSILCGVVAAGLGIHAVWVAWRVQRVPIFTLRWWFVSQGDGTSSAAATQQQTEEDKPKLSEVV